MFGIILLFQTCPLSDQKGMHICYTKADQVSSMYLEKHLPHSIPGPFIVYIWTSWSQLPDSLALLHPSCNFRSRILSNRACREENPKFCGN